eukprot:3183660-Rhodomonas_salina.2
MPTSVQSPTESIGIIGVVSGSSDGTVVSGMSNVAVASGGDGWLALRQTESTSVPLNCARRVSLSWRGVFQSSSSSPPVSPEFGFRHQ